ncbi:MAG TPA: polysaccharide deacetylase family protein [Acidobacteriota bacterium]|nr:polysaccharide deacetylase family protein [Acidobacteriota bacterium]
MKSLIKRAILESHLLQASQRWTASKLAILRYHSVRENPAESAENIGCGITHSAKVFLSQMRYVSSHCRVLGVDQVLEILRDHHPIPSRAVAITFDDGFSDNAVLAADILDRFKISGAFYLTVGSIDSGIAPWFVRLRFAFGKASVGSWLNPGDSVRFPVDTTEGRERAINAACSTLACLAGDQQESALQDIENALGSPPVTEIPPLMMTWQQASMLRNAGHVIGSHSMTHPNLAHVPASAAEKELRDSKARIEEKLGAPVVHFSYPSPFLSPHWNNLTRSLTDTIGYATAVTCDAGPVYSPGARLNLRRIYVPMDFDGFRWHLENTFCGRVL